LEKENEMKNLRLIIFAVALMLVSGVALVPCWPAFAGSRARSDFFDGQTPAMVGAGYAAAAGLAPERSGFWVRVARNASVRLYPGGPEVRAGFRLYPGHYFHVDPKGANGQWSLGFACPNGGRYCNSRENIQGFILISTLGARVSAHGASDLRLAAAAAVGVGDAPARSELEYEAASFNAFAAVSYAAPFTSSRFVCAREVWVRDNRLHPIGILRKGDRFDVERYTDGSGNSGYPVWALGRAYGPGVNPQGKQGRVMVNSLCP
jgi:hypothetical protein